MRSDDVFDRRLAGINAVVALELKLLVNPDGESAGE
jgi:hypothetical protein